MSSSYFGSSDVQSLQNQINNLQESIQYFQMVASNLQNTQTSTDALVRAIQALDIEVQDISGQRTSLYKSFEDLRNYITNYTQNKLSMPDTYNVQLAQLDTRIKILETDIQSLMYRYGLLSRLEKAI